MNSASFPLLFFDGERETSMGNIVVDSSTRYRRFMSLISKRIGVDPQQITVSLICRKFSSESGEKVPILESTNFDAVSCQKDCIFRAVLKRSAGRRKSSGAKKSSSLQPEKIQLLRRGFSKAVDLGRGSAESDAVLELKRLNNAFQFLKPDVICSPPQTTSVGRRLMCKDCSLAKEWPAPFHLCVYDTVTEGFRSKAGPVQRPRKSAAA